MKSRWLRLPWWVLAPASSLAILSLALACAVIAEWRDIRFLQSLAGILLLLALSILAVSAVGALWARKWMAATLFIILFPVALIGGTIGIFLSSLAGRVLGQMEVGPSVLPLPPSALEAAQKTGQHLAAVLSAASGLPLEWQGITLVFNDHFREVAFEFSALAPSNLHARITYRSNPDHSWKRQGWFLSGDSKDENPARPNLEAALQELPLTDWQWPVEPEVERQFLLAGQQLPVAFKDLPLASADCAWKLAEIQLRHFPTWQVANTVTFRCVATADSQPQAWVWSDFRYDGAELWLREVHAGAANSSTREHSAMGESALREWISNGQPPFRLKLDSRGWRSCSADLGEGTRLTYEQRAAHLFLAEYDMRITLSTPHDHPRRFVLPMNTGGRTQVLVFEGQTSSGARAVRLLSPRHFDAAFTLDPPAWCEPKNAGEWKFLGAFLEVDAPLAWFAAAEPAAREAFQRARDRGYPAAWEALQSNFSGTGS